MQNLLLLSVLTTIMLLVTPAAAARWVAQMEEDEGGPAMVASVTGQGGDIPPALRLMCADRGRLNLRFDMGSAADDGGDRPFGNADFLFENEHDQIKLALGYEQMDGAYAAYVPQSDPLLDLLKTGATLFVSDAIGNYAAQSFPLQGSTKAIDTLLKTCS